MGWGSEHLFGQRVLDHSAYQHEDALLAGALLLRHVVGGDQDSVRATQFPEQHLPQRVFDDRVRCL